MSLRCPRWLSLGGARDLCRRVRRLWSWSGCFCRSWTEWLSRWPSRRLAESLRSRRQGRPLTLDLLEARNSPNDLAGGASLALLGEAAGSTGGGTAHTAGPKGGTAASASLGGSTAVFASFSHPSTAASSTPSDAATGPSNHATGAAGQGGALSNRGSGSAASGQHGAEGSEEGGGNPNAHPVQLNANEQFSENGTTGGGSPGTGAGGIASPGQVAQTDPPAAVNPAAATTNTGSTTNPTLAKNYGTRTVAFAKNVGEFGSGVDYAASGQEYSVSLSKSGATVSLHQGGPSASSQTGTGSSGQSASLSLQYVGASSSAQGLGQNEQQASTNYYQGSNSASWYTDVANYGQVTYQNVWSGVDVVYTASSADSQEMEVSYVVHSGANLSQVQYQVQGAQSLSIDQNGNLVIQLANGTLTSQSPTLYQQDASGARTQVAGHYVLLGNNTVGFQVTGSYDSTKSLTVDPTLLFSGYLGTNDEGNAIAVDSAGNSYIAGTSYLPVPPSGTKAQVVVYKLDSSGNLVYTSFLSGASNDYGYGIATDAAGNAYVVGQTSSPNFPSAAGSLSGSTDAFVAKLNGGGDTLIWSAYYGGSGSEAAYGVTVDFSGNVYLTGRTNSTNLTLVNQYQGISGGGYDAFAAEFTSSGSALLWSTYLGGNQDDEGHAIAVDYSGNIVIAGWTASINFPVHNPIQLFNAGGHDAFVSKFSPGGNSLLWSTFLGGLGTDEAYGVAADAAGSVYVTGLTSSTNLPVSTGAYQSTSGGGNDAFVAKIDSGGTSFLYDTYLGGTGDDRGLAIAVDGNGDAFVGGSTTGANFPQVNSMYAYGGGTTDGFLAEVNPNGGSLAFSSYLGGSGADEVRGVALDPAGNLYATGRTTSSNFPNQGTGTSLSGSYDAFAVKVYPGPQAQITAVSPDTGDSSTDHLTNSQNLTLSGTATAGSTVTVYRKGVGAIGTATATGGGTWTFSYAGTTLPEGTYGFTVTATASGVTSVESSVFKVTVDLTAPTVALSVATSTYDTSPQVRVTATDNNGVSTTATLDVDLNNDGNFTDAGETNYSSAAFSGGVAVFDASPNLSTGTYKMRAEVKDKAGNTGYSATYTVTITSTGANSWTTSITKDSTDVNTGDSTSQDGNNTVSQSLDLDQSGGSQSNGAALVYNSNETNSKPVISVAVQTDNSQALSAHATVTLTFNGVTQSSQTYSLSGDSPGDLLTFSQEVSSAVSSSGHYNWSMQISFDYATQVTVTVTGTYDVVVEDSSAFGAGWSLSGVDKLDVLSGGILREYGSGGSAYYANNGSGGYNSPAGDNGTLTAITGGYEYTKPDGEEWFFDTNGHLTRYVSADGFQTTTYTWSSGNLVGIDTPDGAHTTFNYSGSLVSTIQTGSRTYTLVYTGTNLTSIDSPDGSLRSFTYDGSNHLTKDQLGSEQTSYAYDPTYGFLDGWTQGTGSEQGSSTLTPVSSYGLASAAQGNLYAKQTDPTGATTLSLLDKKGRLLVQITADGATTTDVRDNNGWVTSETDPLGRTTSYVRDSAGYVTQETLPDSSLVTFAYESTHHGLTTYTDERSKTTTSVFNSHGQQVSTTDPDGNTTTNVWDTTTGLLDASIDADGNRTSYGYDADRRLVTTTDADGGVTTDSYDTNGFEASVTDQDGNTTSFTNDALGKVLVTKDADGGVTTDTYDMAGNKTKEIDALGHETDWSFDSRGQMTQETQAKGTAVQRSLLYQYNADGEQTASRDADGFWIKQVYNNVGEVVQTINASGATTEAVYDWDGEQIASFDEFGYVQKSSYNVRGWVTMTVDNEGHATSTTYDNAGDVLTQTDALGHTTTNIYDNAGREVSTIDAAGNRTTSVFDNAGNLVKSIDANNKTTTYLYDNMNRQVGSIDQDGNRTTTVYDDVGNVIASTDAKGNSTTGVYDNMNRQTVSIDAQGHRTTSVFDKLSNLINSIDANGHKTTNVFDALNEEIASIDATGKTTTNILDARGETVGQINADGQVSQTLYDDLGQEIGTVDNLGDRTRNILDADGNTVTSIDASGNATNYVYNDLNEQTVSIDANGGRTTSVFDSAGNRTQYIDPDGNKTTFIFDNLNRQIEEIDPLGHVSTTAYDSRGNVSSKTDRDGRRIDYTYDNANRLTQETWVNADSSIADILTYVYDANGNLTQASNKAGTYTMGYDSLNRETSVQGLYNVTLSYVYDNAGNRTAVQDSFGGYLTSTYDNNNRLSTRSYTGQGTSLSYDQVYDAAGYVTKVDRYSNAGGTTKVGETDYTYDSAGRVTNIQHKNGSGTGLAQYTYTYDTGSRLTLQTYNGTNTSYGYDATSQLTNDGGTGYSYDANGNRNMTGWTTGADNQLTNDGTYTYTYDAEGNLSTKSKGAGLETWYYSYDQKNHLTSVRETTDGTTNELTVTYSYDVFGNMVQQLKWTNTSGLATLHEVYDGSEVYMDLDGSNNLQTAYIRGDGANQLESRVSSGTANWYLTDHEGTVRDITNASGSVIDSISYDAFGKILSQTASTVTGYYGFQGMRMDQDLGGYLDGMRFLSWSTGRYSQQDQSGLGPDADEYRFVGNDPTNATDPSGLFEEPPPGAVTGSLILAGIQAVRENPSQAVSYLVGAEYLMDFVKLPVYVEAAKGRAQREAIESAQSEALCRWCNIVFQVPPEVRQKLNAAYDDALKRGTGWTEATHLNPIQQELQYEYGGVLLLDGTANDPKLTPIREQEGKPGSFAPDLSPPPRGFIIGAYHTHIHISKNKEVAERFGDSTSTLSLPDLRRSLDEVKKQGHFMSVVETKKVTFMVVVMNPKRFLEFEDHWGEVAVRYNEAVQEARKRWPDDQGKIAEYALLAVLRMNLGVYYYRSDPTDKDMLRLVNPATGEFYPK
jgi:RHS repeat-associated protein